VIGVIAITVSEPIWGLPHRFRIIAIFLASVTLGLILWAIWLYQLKHLPIQEKGNASLQIGSVTPQKNPLTGNSSFNLQFNNVGTLAAKNVTYFVDGTLFKPSSFTSGNRRYNEKALDPSE